MTNQRFTKLQMAAMALLVVNCVWIIHYGTRTQSTNANETPSTHFFEKKNEEAIAGKVLENMNFDQLTERLHSIEKKLGEFQTQPSTQNCASSSTCPQIPKPSPCPASSPQDPVAQRWPKEGLPMNSTHVRTYLEAVYKEKKSKSVLPSDTWFSADPATAKAAEERMLQEFKQPAGVPEISVWEQPTIAAAGDFNIETPVSQFPVERPFPNSQGFIFIVGSAFGQKAESFLYLKELVFACASIKNKSPGSNITLIATPTIIQKLNQAFGNTAVKFKKPIMDFVFDFYKLVDAVGRPMREEVLRRTRYLPWPHGGYMIKTIGMLLTPYEKTIFLDTDIYFCEKPDPIFTVLDRFDAAAADDVFRHWGSPLTPGFPSSARSVMYDINGGLLAYKWNGYVTKWLIDTVAEFNRVHYPGMQGVLSGLIWAEEDLNFWLLGKEWNCHLIKTHCGDKWGEPKYAIPCRMLHAHSLVDDKDPPEAESEWKTFPMADVRKVMYAIM